MKALMQRILQVQGLDHLVIRTSFIGASIVEFYVNKQHYELFANRLRCNNWEVETEIDITAAPKGNQTGDWKEKMLNRLAFLHASTSLQSLRKCILEGFGADAIKSIEQRSEELMNTRKQRRMGHSTANVLAVSNV